MPKAAPGRRGTRGSAEGVGEGGSEEEQTGGGAALEAVTELDGKFEEWHLQAKQDAAQAKAESAAGHARVSEEIKALTALVAKLNQPPEPVHGRVRGNQEGNPPERAPSSEPEPEPEEWTRHLGAFKWQLVMEARFEAPPSPPNFFYGPPVDNL